MIISLFVPLGSSGAWIPALGKLFKSLGIPEWIIGAIIIIVIVGYIIGYLADKFESSHTSYHTTSYENKRQDLSKKTVKKSEDDTKISKTSNDSKDTEETIAGKSGMSQHIGATDKHIPRTTNSPQVTSTYLLPYSRLSNDRYIILRHLASGGFGNTYLARDNHMNCDVAIKELFLSDKCSRKGQSKDVRVDINTNRDFFIKCKEKFMKEARRLQSFHHPNIVKVFDCFEENATAYYVMEYLPGKSLAATVKEHGPLAEDWVLELLPGILDALQTIHTEHIWHLDIKPANMMLRDDQTAVLIDFGASKQFEDKEGHQLETSSMIAKTNHFAPFEQANNSTKNLGPWTDIYALGATLFYLFTGQLPPTPDNILTDDLPPLPNYISEEMYAAIKTMMQPDRRHRPQNIDEVLRLLPLCETHVSSEEDKTANKTTLNAEDYETQAVTVIEEKKPTLQHALQQSARQATTTNISSSSQTITANGVSFNMICVEGGTFMMGATPEQDSDAFGDENPTHSVTLSTYYIGETEVTQALWQAVMGENPSEFKGINRPVEQVSWDDCKTFISKLNSITGKNFRLPTEAEWEYAARGGNKSKGYKYSGSNSLGNVAWYDNNSGSETHPAKTKSPNELGLFDMSGNVWEWCQDWKGHYDSSSQTNPIGPSSGSNRVCRGGSWFSEARGCRVSCRYYYAEDYRSNYLGLRLVL